MGSLILLYIKTISMILAPTKMKKAYPINLQCQASTTSKKIRIKLKSYELDRLKETCNAIEAIINETGATLSGPVPLPLKKKIFCVLRSPHVNKDSREHFEIREHSRLFDIKVWRSETVDRLLEYEVPSGVDVNV